MTSISEQLTQGQFERFGEFIYKTCGIRIDNKKISMLSSRIRRRASAGGFTDFDAYYRYLTTHPEELEYFLDAVTTNETYFFRTESHFEWFKGDFITGVTLAHRRGLRDKSLRVWSAACSTGEEAYSLSICLAENSLRLRDWKVEIVGTDISEAVLREAREGVYKQRAVESVNETRLRRYFYPEGERWAIRPELGTCVKFVCHNLMEKLNEPAFDCIFLRNVLIYFDRDSKRQVIDRLIEKLLPGGYLVVGPSEGVFDMLAPLKKQNAFLYQKDG